MDYPSFLTSLLETGRVRVPGVRQLTEEAVRAGDQVLCTFEAQYRLEMPGDPPALELSAAKWAAMQFFRACQFSVYRDVPLEVIEELLGTTVPCPTVPAASQHYSVDLVFRFLPDLLRFARSAAESDPLIQHLMRWARDWPLSSVGVSLVSPVSELAESTDALAAVVGHPSLLALYVDRIIAVRDVPRLADPRVREAVGAALGLHPDLAPQLVNALGDRKQ